MRIIGLDVGDRRIGVALSDASGVLASPFTIVQRNSDEQAISDISAIIREQGAGLVISGLPRSMSGEEGTQAEKVRAFIAKMSNVIDVPVEFRDERLTTVSAIRMMQSAGKKKKSKTKEYQDARAAAVILQGYLDEIKQQNSME